MRVRPGRILRLLVVAICLAWLGWIIASLGPLRIYEVARTTDPLWLAVSFAPLFLRFLVWALKWTLMLRRRGPVRYRDTLRALLSGAFVNLTTPTAKLAGGFVRAALIHRRTGWGMATSYGWSLADQVTNVIGNLGLYGVLALAAIPYVAPGPSRTRFAVSGAVALATVASLLVARRQVWAVVRRPSLSRWMARVTPERFRTAGDEGEEAGWVRPVFEPLLSHGATHRVAAIDLPLAACSFGSLCLANAVLLGGMGTGAPLVPVAAVVVIGYFAGTVLGTLGGIGVTEVVLIQLYMRVGVDPETAAAAALLHRASYYLVTLAWGGLSLLGERRRPPRGKAQA